MEKHCNKYESLFVFSDEKTLNEHLSICEECAQEHEKMQKVSSLVREVKDQFDSRNKVFNALRVACVLFVFICGAVIFSTFEQNERLYSYDITNSDDSVISSMGLPTDDYGLLFVD